MLEKLKGEALPLRRSFDSLLQGSAQWRKATAALWVEGHTPILLGEKKATDKMNNK